MKYIVGLLLGIVCFSLTQSAGLRGKSLKGKKIAGRQMNDPYAGDIIKVAIVETPETWQLAEQFCEMQGGMLLKITDKDIEGELEEYLDQYQELIDREFWIGANDLDENGKFVYPDGSDVKYWHGADVPNKDSEGNCVALSPHGEGSFSWEVRPCNKENEYICELPMDDEEDASSEYVPDDFDPDAGSNENVPDDFDPEACNENGDYAFDCETDPCDVETCPANPDTICILDNCGGCFARFYDITEGDEVDCTGSNSGSNSDSDSNSDSKENCNDVSQECDDLNLCDKEVCFAYPDAECVISDCGKCCTDWYDNGHLVDCDDACCMQPEKGDCQEELPRYYYNCETKKCETFTWSGCDGNDNNFETEDECRFGCAIWGDTEPELCSKR